MSLREQAVKNLEDAGEEGDGAWAGCVVVGNRMRWKMFVRGNIGRLMGGQRTSSILLRIWHWFSLITCALFICEADNGD